MMLAITAEDCASNGGLLVSPNPPVQSEWMDHRVRHDGGQISTKGGNMMKTLISMLFGIATLIGSVIGSVATADDHKYEYLLSGIQITKNQIVRVMGTSGQTVTVNVEVYDDNGVEVGSHSLTLQPDQMRRVLSRPTEITGTGSDRVFRTVRIIATERLWVHAVRKLWGEDSAVTIPVFEKIVPCSHATHFCRKDDDDEDTKGN